MTNVRRTKLDPSIVKELQSSRLLASQAITQSRISQQRNTVNYQNFRLVNLPVKGQQRFRNSKYAHQDSRVTDAPHKFSDLHNLDFTLDDVGGVSQQAQIRYWDYNVAIHRYLTLDNQELHRSTIRKQ